MKLLIAGHALAATAVIFASVVTVRFIGVAPLWVGVLVGLFLYALTLWIAKADAGQEIDD
ncbi:MAG TPA: hypothetical protein VFR80_16160 [Pyrinomonadaceae bacterium]|nr:hypothetical protein [Pyrinomonadaceae bacterium]